MSENLDLMYFFDKKTGEFSSFFQLIYGL